MFDDVLSKSRQRRILRVLAWRPVCFRRSDAWRKLRQELRRPWNAFDEFSPEDGERRHVFAGENFHLVIADHNSDVWPRCIENVRELANGLLATSMPLSANVRGALFREALCFSERHQLIERIGLAFIEMKGVSPIDLRALRPQFRRNRKHWSVRCA